MAHFAQLDENNIVTRVIVVGNQDLLDSNGNESEEIGIEFCKTLYGEDTNWKKTSYNRSFRKNYAGRGDIYDENLDAFITSNPYPSWILNPDTAKWEPPVPMPDDGKLYTWSENSLSWV